MSKVLNTNEFNELIGKEKIVLVDFYADWCGPCKVMGGILEEIEKELAGKATVCKVNVDSDGELAQKYNVVTIPNINLIVNGETVKTFIGVTSKEDIVSTVNSYL